MSIIEQLKDDLAQAKIDKEKVVAPYVARIKYLENAIKYSNDNGEIEINVMYKSGKIMVEIFNSGENINEKDINHIWDRFYKSDKSRTNKISTGLGLPIVRLILSQHNEDIWVKNIPGKGVKFIFTLSKSH